MCMDTESDAQESASAPRMDEKTRLRYAAMLKPRRIEMGLRQEDIASQAGIARNTYAAMETGKRVPQVDNLWRAMGVLGLRPDQQTIDPPWFEAWLAVIRPLALELPAEKRGEAMGRIVQVLYEISQAK